MPVYEYACKNGHRVERILPISEFTEKVVCEKCTELQHKEVGPYRPVWARLVPSRTGTPILKAGKGGFYKPSRPDRTE